MGPSVKSLKSLLCARQPKRFFFSIDQLKICYKAFRYHYPLPASRPPSFKTRNDISSDLKHSIPVFLQLFKCDRS